jgi:TRAP-type C4-dicarboxylate transport system permease small subunit
MGALARWLPPRQRLVAGVCADVFGAVVSAALAWYSWIFVSDSREFGDTLLGDVPAWWLQSIMPVAFALMAARFLIAVVNRARGGASSEVPV